MQPQYPAQYPQQPAAPAYPQQPQGYPAQQPAYPPQNYHQPAPAYPPQGYPQAYAQPQYAPPAPPAAPLPAVNLDDYWQQPSSSGGPSLKFKDAAGNPQIGKTYEGFVARPITDADVRPQTNNAGVVQTFRDGRVKSVMVVPLLVQPSQEFPDGQAGWWVKGQSRDELARAMAEAGAPAGAPESGAFVRIQLVNVRPIPNMSPAFQYRVDYVRPGGQPPAAQPVQQQAPVQQPTYAAPQAPAQQMAPVAYQQPVPPQQPVAAAAPQAAPQPAPAAAPAAAPSGFSPEQQALFAKLTGQQPAPAA
jgi:hypothetical protein